MPEFREVKAEELCINLRTGETRFILAKQLDPGFTKVVDISHMEWIYSLQNALGISEYNRAHCNKRHCLDLVVLPGLKKVKDEEEDSGTRPG